ncbi:uncharacterized mitochondrial protein AtMg00810-like [Nicotiana tomentosiformis]|uniref:uncharacterized mitochondrial protein AtMg00810-like n=1 Tax=Nicotiana tomentosiformis TaxID=4098 RepID=UPI00388C890C
MVIIRAVIALAAMNQLSLFQMDVYNVFLSGDLEKEVYMQLPPGFGDDVNLINEAKDILQHAFKMKGLGILKYFLGIEVCRSQKRILLCQRKYALELISELGLGGSKPAVTPMEQNRKLTTIEYDLYSKLHDDVALTDVREYRRLVGKLLYLTITTPDIAYSVQTLSQLMQSPKKSHLEVAYRIVRYIKNKLGLGILMSSEGGTTLKAYCDVNWESYPNSRRSITGYLVKLGSSLKSWKTKK